MALTYQEREAAIGAAHEAAKQSKYGLLKVSERRYAVVVLSGDTSVTSVTGSPDEFVGVRRAELVDGLERVELHVACAALFHLRQSEIAGYSHPIALSRYERHMEVDR